MKSLLISDPDVVTTIDEAQEIANDIREKIFAQHEMVFVVHICECDDAGVYERENINVFYTYEQLNEELNCMQYAKCASVDVYYATREHVISMLYKTFDGTSYSRYAMVAPRPYEPSMWRRFMDRPINVYSVTC